MLKNFFKRMFHYENIPLVIILVLMLLMIPLSLLKKYSSTLQYYFTDGIKLFGMQEAPPPPSLTLKNIVSGKWKNYIEDSLIENILLRRLAILTHNQFYYSVFSKSYMHNGTLVMGKKGYFFEDKYISSYCNLKNINYQIKDLKEWADKIQSMADFFATRGQKFIYLISPSKASFYPEYIPSRYPCDPTFTRPNYHLGLAALKERNIIYIDASQILNDSKEIYKDLLFPKGGIHWTTLATALVTQEILQKAELPSLNFTYEVSYNPQGLDSDLLDLSNLAFPDHNYPVPILTFEKSKESKITPHKLATVGTSFTDAINEILKTYSYFNSIDAYFYFDMNYFRYPDLGTETLELDQSTIYDNILMADIVILEENEEHMGIPGHFYRFKDYIDSLN